jgi:NodT family efflux transporter outer membrane factor (OMF) lipoprotein
MTRLLVPLLTLLVAGCASGPDYQRPAAPIPATWKEAGTWRPAKPGDAVERGAWWTVFHDPELDALVAQVAVSNQNLLAAEAAWRQATAVLSGAQASTAPTVGVAASAQRTGTGPMPVGDAFSRSGDGRTVDHYVLQGTVSWAPDLWGRLRRTTEGAQAGAEASAADYAGARLAAQASLATLYLRVRAIDVQRDLLSAIATADERALTITRQQHAAGLVAGSDALQAEAQLAGIQAEIVGLGIQRAQNEHAIALLIGKTPSEVTLANRSELPSLPDVPGLVPSELLERRPDIAAAERRMAVANAQIGIAQAAYYPDLTLSGALGYAGGSAGALVQASNLLWSFGAETGAVLFDGGARSAKVEQAKAGWDQAVAQYRQTVLAAFQQTEDQLAAGRILDEQMTVITRAVAAATGAEQAILNQYQAGSVGFAAVIVAQNTTRNYRLQALQIQADRLVAAVGLITALGGEWHDHQLGARRE